MPLARSVSRPPQIQFLVRFKHCACTSRSRSSTPGRSFAPHRLGSTSQHARCTTPRVYLTLRLLPVYPNSYSRRGQAELSASSISILLGTEFAPGTFKTFGNPQKQHMPVEICDPEQDSSRASMFKYGACKCLRATFFLFHLGFLSRKPGPFQKTCNA